MPAGWLGLSERLVTLDLEPRELDQVLDDLAADAALERPLRQGLAFLTVAGTSARDHRRRRQLLGHLVLLRAAPSLNLTLPLVACVLDPDPAVAGASALAIGLHPTRYPGAVVALAEALRETTSAPETRLPQAWCLRRLLQAHPELFRFFPDEPSPRVRRIMLEAMARFLTEDAESCPDAGLLSMLASLIREGAADPDPVVRRQAFAAFRLLDVPCSRELCEEALADPDRDVRQAAVDALASAGGDAVTWLVDQLADGTAELRRHILEALERASEGAVPEAVRQRAREGDGRARRWALQALGALGGAEAVNELTAGLDAELAEVRAAGALALAGLAFRSDSIPALRQVEPRLLERLGREEEPRILIALAEALVQIGSGDVGNVVLSRLAVQQDAVRERLLEILARGEQFPARPDPGGLVVAPPPQPGLGAP